MHACRFGDTAYDVANAGVVVYFLLNTKNKLRDTLKFSSQLESHIFSVTDNNEIENDRIQFVKRAFRRSTFTVRVFRVLATPCPSLPMPWLDENI